MLKEYLLSQGSGTGRWSHGMPGVQICRFSLPEPEQEPLRSVPVCGAPLQFEVLFCLTGRLAVRPLQGTSYTVEAPAIFLLSDSSALRSCQYCRVSTDDEEQLTSYEAQQNYYTDKIMTNREWTMAGIFADEGITGTSARKRPEFLKMIRLCKQKKIDIVLTKSISRFARNTVD